MKILFIDNTGLVSAGAFHSMVALIERLMKKGVIASVALPSFADGMDLLNEKHIRFFRFKPCSYSWMINKASSKIEYLKMPVKKIVVLLGAVCLALYIKKNKIELVHENTSACYIGYYAAKLSGVKHVWHIREFMEEDFNCEIWGGRKSLSCFSKSDAVVAVSQAIYRKYENLIHPDIFKVVFNGIDVDRFYCPEHVIFENNVANILCVGRITAAKGQICLIEAVGLLKKKGVNVKLFIAGEADDAYYNEVVAKIKVMNVDDSVCFLGQRNDVDELYKKCDVFCMCSRAEAFGRVTVEAMLSGCLVVGCNSGGTAEIIRNDDTGLLFSPGDSKNLAEKIAYALRHTQKMRKVAEKGQEYALLNFNADKNANEIFSLYKSILQ